MDQDARDPRLGMGGNNPPEPTLKERLTEQYQELAREVEKVAKAATDAPKKVSSDEDLDAIGVVVVDARKLLKKVDADRKEEKAVFDDLGKVVQAHFTPLTERLDRVVSVLEERASIYQREKRDAERRRLEEEARKLREKEAAERAKAEAIAEAGRSSTAAKAEDRAKHAADRADRLEAKAEGKAADLTRVRGDSGTLATSKGTWKGEITDLDKLDIDKLRPYLKRDDLQKALNNFVRMGGRELSGARIFEDIKASFR